MKQGLFERKDLYKTVDGVAGGGEIIIQPELALRGDEYSVILVRYNVKPSMYCTGDFPECEAGFPNATAQFDSYVAGLGSLGSALTSIGATAGGVITIAAAATISAIANNEGNLGIIGNWIRDQRTPPHAQCINQFTVVPVDSVVTRVEFSNRDGNEQWGCPTGGEVSTQDWAGWRHFQITEREGRQIVSATAVNWKHDHGGGTNQYMRVFIKKR